jgi:hypothetical protein
MNQFRRIIARRDSVYSHNVLVGVPNLTQTIIG